MPLFMDIHHTGDMLDVQHAAEDHAADLRVQGSHNVRYLCYWVDETHGKIFCLVDAPYAEAAMRYFLRNATNQKLPRKFKITYSASEADRGLIPMHDFGIALQETYRILLQQTEALKQCSTL